MNFLIFFFGMTIGFVLGALGSTIAHLNKEIERAERDGHRR